MVTAAAFTGGFTTTQVQADVRVLDQSSTLTFVAILFGHNGVASPSNGLYVKIQRQLAGGFSHIGIYTGAGSNTTTVTTPGGNFQALAAPITAARMTVRANGATELYTGLDTDFNGTDEVSYVSTLSGVTLGDRVGLHVWGTTSAADNFNATVVPEPATFAVLGLGALGLLLRRRK
jgi:hypothetical protein